MQTQEAEAKARVFNAREALFGKELTDYESLSKIRKNLEPYAGLWITTRDWRAACDKWQKGPFLGIDAEQLETEVEK